MLNISLEFNQKDFRRLAVSNAAVPTHVQNAPGSMLVRLERFGFSSNNLASALAPGLASVWPQAFPAGTDRLRLPVWGVAQVVAANQAVFEPGACFFGCFPMTRFALIDPSMEPLERYGIGADQLLNPTGGHLPVPADTQSGCYNAVDLQIMLRPLLMAAFMVMEELKESQFWHAQQIVVTCASSKTAMGLGYFLQQHFAERSDGPSPQVIGLTAQSNVNFVRKHGHFDKVLSYEQFRAMDEADTVLVDFSGNFSVQRMLVYYLKQHLIHAYALGAAHWDEVASGELAMSCEYFSALDFYYQRHARSKDLNYRFQQLWPNACGAFIKWLKPQLVEGPDRVRWVYEQVLAGKSKPDVAYLCKL
ncbi:DUF2855 family protein [Halioxenophilus aromaticivorans]|uniref:DUF2855 domain-containing protein n=1 Tax=Halioxenophilus aromaticivorans TaxID=1306992 RepID=A0AAV3U4H9_9ALTE